MSSFTLYKIIASVSVVVRTYFLPNPFEYFGDKAALMNLIAEAIIHIIVYKIVGRLYTKGTNPALGSFLYLMTYTCIVVGLWTMGCFSFAWWWSFIVGIVMAALFSCGEWLKERLS